MITQKKLGGHQDERGMLHWLSPKLLDFDYKSIIVGSINPGYKRGGHYHKKTHELLVCVSGKLTFILGEEKTTMEPGDTVEVPLNAMHWLANEGSETAYFLELKSAEFDKNDPDTFRN